MRLSFGNCVLDSERRMLERGGQPVHLSPKAFAVLQFLIAQSPRAVSKQELLDEVWPDVVVEEENVKNVVFEIRDALGADRDAIQTVQRFGYAFTGDLRSPLAAARLVGEDRVYSLRPGDNVIGRDSASMISIEATGVSRRHARITVADCSATLEDLGSKNGTWRNEQRIAAPVELHDGDSIRIGKVKLTFRTGAGVKATTTLPGC